MKTNNITLEMENNIKTIIENGPRAVDNVMRACKWIRTHIPAIIATVGFAALIIVSYLALKNYAPQFLYSLDLNK